MARRKLAKQTTFKKDNPKILTSAKLYSAILENPKVKESKRNLTLADVKVIFEAFSDICKLGVMNGFTITIPHICDLIPKRIYWRGRTLGVFKKNHDGTGKEKEIRYVQGRSRMSVDIKLDRSFENYLKDNSTVYIDDRNDEDAHSVVNHRSRVL